MKKPFFEKICIIFAVFLILIISESPVIGQEVLLDKMEKCGDLLCYPTFKDANAFYYLPDQPRLAYKDGKPQFSFLKYARTSATGKAGTGRAQGGGILHFLVTYGATEQRVKAAEKELQERHPDAKIMGPIVYRKGSFALITSFKEGNTTTTRTVAVGKAPLMEGQKAAVSMALTREGAELLWESFKSDTPDISLVFDMEFAGVRNPYEAKIIADWSRVSQSQSIKAGMKYKWFGADVDMLFQELRQTEAVKIITKGQNAQLDKILQAAHAKLLNVMFDPAPSPELTRAASENSYSNLNQAVQLLRNAVQTRRSSSGSSSSGSGSRSSSTSRSSSMLSPMDIGPGTLLWAAMMNVISANAYADTQVPVVADPTSSSDSGDAATDDQSLARQRFDEGVRLGHEGDYRHALEAFQEADDLGLRATGSDRRSGTVSYNIGLCHYKLGNYAQAEEYFEEALRRLPEDSEYREGITLRLEETRRRLNSSDSGDTSTGETQSATEDTPTESATDAYNRARRLDADARDDEFSAQATRAALDAYERYQQDHNPTGSRAEEVSGRIRMLRSRLEASGEPTSTAATDSESSLPQLLPNPFTEASSSSSSGGTSSGTSSASASSGSQSSSTSSAASSSSSSASPNTQRSTSSSARPSSGTSGSRSGSGGSSASQRSSGNPGFSLVASYKLRKLKSSGKLEYEMNHYSNETQAFAMAENIGAIYKKYGNDSRVFRAVTIDDPVFKQREILVTLDGQDTETFTKYLNFVTVKMKKRHQRGDVTTGEVVITPEIFNSSGNNFSMTYGWKDDSDRTKWLDYEYQAIWSFHGGVEIRTPWEKTDSPMLALSPPHRYRTVSIEGSGRILSRADVRHGVITFSCRLGDRYIPQQVTIRNNSPAPTMLLEIPEDPDNPETKIDITWYLTKSRKLTAAQTQLEGDIIYWDELPKGGI